MAGPIIRLEGVAKRFGQTAAVDDVSLEVNEGEFFALLGPSGCGKTTLLRLLAGFETPSAGRILIDGEDVGSTPPNRRPVNMVFQSYAVFPHMSVADNVGYGLRMDRVPEADLRRRVDEALALVQLEDLGGRRPHQVSGGRPASARRQRSIRSGLSAAQTWAPGAASSTGRSRCTSAPRSGQSARAWPGPHSARVASNRFTWPMKSATKRLAGRS